MPRTPATATPLRIVFACHANFDHGTHNLNEEGIERTHHFAATLKANGFGGDGTLVMRSTDQRAKQTADIIGADIHSKVQPHEFLYRDSLIRHPYDELDICHQFHEWGKYRDFINKLPAKHRDIVVVTHQPNVLAFTKQFASVSGAEYFIPRLSGAAMYSIVAKSWRHIDYREFAEAKIEMRYLIDETRRVPS